MAAHCNSVANSTLYLQLVDLYTIYLNKLKNVEKSVRRRIHLCSPARILINKFIHKGLFQLKIPFG